MGGGIAMFAGIDNAVKTVALCPAPMSPACQKALGDDKIRHAISSGKTMNLMTEKCWVTSHTKLAKLGRAYESVTGKTIPHFIGPGYRINHTPQNVQRSIDGHNPFMKFFDYHNYSASSWQELAAS
jgi:glycine cleavage system pyridoxal-binding protein P